MRAVCELCRIQFLLASSSGLPRRLNLRQVNATLSKSYPRLKGESKGVLVVDH